MMCPLQALSSFPRISADLVPAWPAIPCRGSLMVSHIRYYVHGKAPTDSPQRARRIHTRL